MAWSQQKNHILFERASNWANAVVNLLEERDRLVALYANEANGEATFVDTDITTTAELIALATNVMNPLSNMVNNAVVTTAARMQYLTPFLTNKQ